VVGRFDLDPAAKARAGELRAEMKQASLEIAKNPERMREAEREGIGSQVKILVRQAERERGLEKGRGVEKDDGGERQVQIKGWTYKAHSLEIRNYLGAGNEPCG
jgi:hypothetical protein